MKPKNIYTFLYIFLIFTKNSTRKSFCKINDKFHIKIIIFGISVIGHN